MGTRESPTRMLPMGTPPELTISIVMGDYGNYIEYINYLNYLEYLQ